MDEDYDNETGIVGVPAQLAAIPLADKLPRGYLSVSQVTQYLKCGAAYAFRYVDGLTVPGNNYTIQGRAVHKAAETLHLAMINDVHTPGNLTSEAEMESVYSDMHDKELVDNSELLLIDVQNWGQVKDEGLMLTRQYRKGALGDLINPDTGFPLLKIQPVAAELTVKVVLTPEEGEPIPFLGVIDLEEADAIVDLKNKKKACTQAEADNSLQLTLYAHIRGKSIVRLDQLVKPTKTKGVRYIRTQAYRNTKDVKHALHVVQGVTNAIVAGNFMRTNPENWWCSSKWCAYWGSCRGKD